MNTRRAFLLTTLIGALTLGASAIAGGKHGEGHMGKKLERMEQALGLSADQKEQVRQVMESHRATMKSYREQMKNIKESLHALDPSAPDYDARLETLANTKANLVRDKTIAKGQKRKQMAAILTPDQQAKMKEMHAKRKERRHRKRGGHHDH